MHIIFRKQNGDITINSTHPKYKLNTTLIRDADSRLWFQENETHCIARKHLSYMHGEQTRGLCKFDISQFQQCQRDSFRRNGSDVVDVWSVRTSRDVHPSTHQRALRGRVRQDALSLQPDGQGHLRHARGARQDSRHRPAIRRREHPRHTQDHD